MFTKRIVLGIGSAALAAAVLAGCGGGSSSSSGASGTVSGVITGFGSVYVNGVEYVTDAASITIDGVQHPETDLAVGMVVTLQGSSSGATGQATNISFADELEGVVVSSSVAANGTGTLDVMGRTVTVDANTVFDANGSGIATIDLIAAGNVVEVSGYPSADGSIFATRVEVKALDVTAYATDHPGVDFEMKGVVSALDVTTFTLGSLTVDYSSVVSMPVLSDGLYVEVKSDSAPVGGVLTATSIEIEDDGELGQQGDAGEEVKLQGLVTDITGLPDSFALNGQTVLIGAGSLNDGLDWNTLTVGMELTIEGYFDSNGDLVIDGVEAGKEDNLEFAGMVEAVDALAGTITMFGQTFSVNTTTMMMDESSSTAEFYFDITDILVGDYLGVHLYQDVDLDTLTATRIERDDAPTGGDPAAKLSGVVTTVADGAGFTVAGVTIDWTGTAPLVADVVEVEGSYVSGVFTATSVGVDN